MQSQWIINEEWWGRSATKEQGLIRSRIHGYNDGHSDWAVLIDGEPVKTGTIVHGTDHFSMALVEANQQMKQCLN